MKDAISKSDSELISIYLKGENSAIDELFSRHSKRIYNYIAMMIGDRTLAEDLMQETFIRIVSYLRRGSYTENGKFLQWMLRIAHNIVIDYIRTKKTPTDDISKDSVPYDLFAKSGYFASTTEDDIIDSETSKQIRDLVNNLPKEQKEVVILRHYNDLSFNEIAEQTGVNINTALGRMRYALINLRKMIEEHNIQLG